jgi:hypothetical protein
MKDGDSADVARLLGHVADAAARRALQPEQRFNALNYLRVNETDLSRCIAGLLDPMGEHGQGDVFLRLFLEALGFEEWAEAADWSVQTEALTRRRRRLDIQLTSNRVIIGIENKPWAIDQDRQLQDYAEHLDEKARAFGVDWLLVYLCDSVPSGDCIDEEILRAHTEERRFVQLNFRQVEQWLLGAASRVQAGEHTRHLRSFLESLAGFVRRHVSTEMDMGECPGLFEAIVSNEASLAASFAVAGAIQRAKARILDEWIDGLEAALGADGFRVLCEREKLLSGKAYSVLSIVFEESQDLMFKLGFERMGHNEFIWGIAKRDTNVGEVPERWAEVHARMTRALGSGRDSRHWPWYSLDTLPVLGHRIPNWRDRHEPWLLLRGDSTGASIMQRVHSIARTVRTAVHGPERVLSTWP